MIAFAESITFGVTWRVTLVDKKGVGRYLGSIVAPDRDAADKQARATFRRRNLLVLAAASWAAMSARERMTFMGLDVPVPKKRHAVKKPAWRPCQGCGEPIHYLQWGRPPKYHEECAPDNIRRSRRYQKTLIQSRASGARILQGEMSL